MYLSFDLVGSIWVTDDLVGQLSSLKAINSINLGNTNITIHSACHLKGATQLKALNIGSTKIKGNYIVDLANSLRSVLRKLVLKGLGITENVSGRGTLNTKQLQQIGSAL